MPTDSENLDSGKVVWEGRFRAVTPRSLPQRGWNDRRCLEKIVVVSIALVFFFGFRQVLVLLPTPLLFVVR